MLLTLLTTDGIFERVTYPDNPVSRSAFTTERNLDAQYPKERLRATQAARERAGILGQPARSLEMPLLLGPAPRRKRSAALRRSTSIDPCELASRIYPFEEPCKFSFVCLFATVGPCFRRVTTEGNVDARAHRNVCARGQLWASTYHSPSLPPRAPARKRLAAVLSTGRALP
jgi:hypothetical protein